MNELRGIAALSFKIYNSVTNCDTNQKVHFLLLFMLRHIVITF